MYSQIYTGNWNYSDLQDRLESLKLDLCPPGKLDLCPPGKFDSSAPEPDSCAPGKLYSCAPGRLDSCLPWELDSCARGFSRDSASRMRLHLHQKQALREWMARKRRYLKYTLIREYTSRYCTREYTS